MGKDIGTHFTTYSPSVKKEKWLLHSRLRLT